MVLHREVNQILLICVPTHVEATTATTTATFGKIAHFQCAKFAMDCESM